MKTHKFSGSFIRRSAFLLFLSMLLSVFTVFPSFVASAEVSGGVIADGVYRISNSYFDSYNGSYGSFYLRANGTSVNLSTESYADMRYDLCSYWKFEHQGSNVYLIRNMANPNLVLYDSGNGVTLYDTSSGQMPTSMYFQLGTGSAKTIKSIVNTSKCLTVGSVTPTDATSYYYTSVVMADYAGMQFENWVITEADIAGIYFRDSEDNTLRSSFGGIAYLDDITIDVSDYGYVCYAYNTSLSGAPTITWQSGNTNIATVNASGTVTLLKTGTVTITGSISTGQSVSYTLTVISDHGLKDDTEYHIMNYSSGYYMSLAQESNTNSVNVITQESKSQTVSQWRTDKQSGLQYQLVSVYSSTNKVLDVNGTNVDIYSDLGQTYQKFSIVRIDSGIYRGCYYIRYGDYYVAEDSSHNVYITSTPSASAVWSFSATQKGNAETYDFLYDYLENNEDKKYDSTANHTNFISVFNARNYAANAWTNYTSLHAYTRLQGADVFVFRGHGGAGIIEFYGMPTSTATVYSTKVYGESTGCIAVNSSVANRYVVGTDRQYIESLSSNSLSSLRCALLIGCSTGNDITISGKTYNILEAVYEKGAHFVLGTTQTIDTSDNDDFLTGFLAGVGLGYDVYGCVAYGIQNAGDDVELEDNTVGTYPAYYFGDSVQYLQ